jgi:uncharacterized protein (DUF2126 family)
MSDTTAQRVEQRLRNAGIRLTFGGEPTYVPRDPQGAEWTVAADGPTKLSFAKALAAELQRRVWPLATLLYCSGKRYEGETNPRWALRLITRCHNQPLVVWPQRLGSPAVPPPAGGGRGLLEAIGEHLGCRLHPIALRDPLDQARDVWAAPLCHDNGHWQGALWSLGHEQRRLSKAPGPAGLRLPLEHLPEGIPRQVLTLERSHSGWGLFLPPVSRLALEQLIAAIATISAPWQEPELSGVLPLDIAGHWQVLGLTADPGVLEVNLPVCETWAEYAHWLAVLEEAGDAVGLVAWKREGNRRVGTGGGNHLLWGGPSLEPENHPFFCRPAWLVAVLRYWQHHPCLAYLFSGRSVGPASQAPRPDEGSAAWLDLVLAHQWLEQLGDGDQRVAISETLRHLHADRSGNTHRSEISLDKFWNPAWPAGCQGLIEFRALETMPHHQWNSAVALLWRALAVHLLDPRHRPDQLIPWGAHLHDQAMLPSQLWGDLEAILQDLAADQLALDPEPFRQIWHWRFPSLLSWQDGSSNATLEIREALEPWPLLCDTPVEGGLTSRFVDSSLRRFEVIGNADFHDRYQLHLNGRRLPQPAEPGNPLAVRYRHDAFYPCLNPCLPVQVPLQLVLQSRYGLVLDSWQLDNEQQGFQQVSPPEGSPFGGQPWRGAWKGACTVDLRLGDAAGDSNQGLVAGSTHGSDQGS